MEIITDRLQIKLLTLTQLKFWVNANEVLGKELNCIFDSEPMDESFKNFADGQIKKMEQDQRNSIYYSFWLIIRKNDRMVIGSMGYKNIPNEKYEVEIGYGLNKKYEHNGYMTEAVKYFCEYSFKTKGIIAIIAETEKENIPSQGILKRTGFKKYKEDETIWWKLNKDK